MITNPYKVLGVPDGASEEECAKAYKKLAKNTTPTSILTTNMPPKKWRK